MTIPASPSTTPPRPLVVAAAVLDSLDQPTRVLCAARSYPERYAGCYELPGGKTEPGETPQEALARELMEEIHLQVRLGEELVAPAALREPGAGASWPVLGGYRMRVWLAEPARPTDSPRLGASHQSLDWVGLERIACLPWLSADLPIVEQLVEHLRHRPSTASAGRSQDRGQSHTTFS